MTPRLSILFPTYRFDALARQNIAAVATCGSADVEVLIGDNSTSPNKRVFLEQVRAISTNVHVYCHARNIGADANYRHLLDRGTGQWCCLAADDDVFTADYFLGGAALLAAHPDAAVGAGFILGATPRPGGPADLFRVQQRLEETAFDRIVAYDSYNMIPYGVTRREHMQRVLRYVHDTPLPASFMDFLGAYSALAEGKFRIDETRPLYLYMNNNWRDEVTSWVSSAKFYVAIGLPEAFQHFHAATWIIACLHFFLSRYRPPALDEAEAERIAAFLVLRFLTHFREQVARDDRLCRDQLEHDPAAQQALTDFLNPLWQNPAYRFSRFLVILTAFSPELASRYDTFLRTSLVHAIHAPGSAEDLPPL